LYGRNCFAAFNSQHTFFIPVTPHLKNNITYRFLKINVPLTHVLRCFLTDAGKAPYVGHGWNETSNLLATSFKMMLEYDKYL